MADSAKVDDPAAETKVDVAKVAVPVVAVKAAEAKVDETSHAPNPRR